MANLTGCFSSNTDNWQTPYKIYQAFKDLQFVDTFPFRANYNELDNNYYNDKLFINPPYSKLKNKDYYEWIINQINNNNQIALLVPARTDTKWFRSLLPYADSIVFITGRLCFNDMRSAPFPSILMLFGYFYLFPFMTINKDKLAEFIYSNL